MSARRAGASSYPRPARHPGASPVPGSSRARGRVMRLPAIFRLLCQLRSAAGVQQGRPSAVLLLARDGVAGAGAAEALGFVVTEVGRGIGRCR